MSDFFKIIFLLALIVLFLLVMRKLKYNFKGFELIPFWLSFTFFIYIY